MRIFHNAIFNSKVACKYCSFVKGLSPGWSLSLPLFEGTGANTGSGADCLAKRIPGSGCLIVCVREDRAGTSVEALLLLGPLVLAAAEGVAPLHGRRLDAPKGHVWDGCISGMECVPFMGLAQENLGVIVLCIK